MKILSGRRNSETSVRCESRGVPAARPRQLLLLQRRSTLQPPAEVGRNRRIPRNDENRLLRGSRGKGWKVWQRNRSNRKDRVALRGVKADPAGTVALAAKVARED